MAERSHGNNPEPRVELYTGMDGAGDCARGGFAEPEMLSAESALSGGRDGVQVAKTAMGSGGAPRSEVVLTGDCSLRLLQFILFFMHGSRHRGSIVLKHRDAGRSRIVASKPCFFPRLSGFSFPPPNIRLPRLRASAWRGLDSALREAHTEAGAAMAA